MKVSYYESLNDQWVPSIIEYIMIKTKDGIKVKVSQENIDNLLSFGEVSTSDSKPSYSVSKNNKWYGLDDNLNEVTTGYDTHKELKKDLDVDTVKGYTLNDDKYYALIYEPEVE